MVSVSVCAICFGFSFQQGEICSRCSLHCRNKNLIFRDVDGFPIFSLFSNTPSLRKIVSRWKKRESPQMLSHLSIQAVQKLSLILLEPVAGVIPMPARNFGDRDHAFSFGENIANYFHAPIAPEFLERKMGGDQKSKSLEKRREQNLRLRSDFLEFSKEKGVWILADDIVTSGATLKNAWTLLGCPRALGLTLASTPKLGVGFGQ